MFAFAPAPASQRPEQHPKFKPKKYYLFTDIYKDLDDAAALILLKKEIAAILAKDPKAEIEIVTSNEVMFNLTHSRVATLNEISEKPGDCIPMRAATMYALLQQDDDFKAPLQLDQLRITAGAVNLAYQENTVEDEKIAIRQKEEEEKKRASATQATEQSVTAEEEKKRDAEITFNSPYHSHSLWHDFTLPEVFYDSFVNKKWGKIDTNKIQPFAITVNELKKLQDQDISICSISPLTDVANLLKTLSSNNIAYKLFAMLGSAERERPEHNIGQGEAGSAESFFSSLASFSQQLDQDKTLSDQDKRNYRPVIIPLDITRRGTPLEPNTFSTVLDDLGFSALDKAILQIHLNHMDRAVFKKYGGCNWHDPMAMLCAINQICVDLEMDLPEYLQAYMEKLELVEVELAVVDFKRNRASDGNFGLYVLADKLPPGTNAPRFTARVPRCWAAYLQQIEWKYEHPVVEGKATVIHDECKNIIISPAFELTQLMRQVNCLISEPNDEAAQKQYSEINDILGAAKTAAEAIKTTDNKAKAFNAFLAALGTANQLLTNEPVKQKLASIALKISEMLKAYTPTEQRPQAAIIDSLLNLSGIEDQILALHDVFNNTLRASNQSSTAPRPGSPRPS